MTRKHKRTLLHFILRTPMWIPCVDEHNIISFIRGQESIASIKNDFTVLLQKHFEDDLAIRYRHDGWPGQVRQYSDQKGISWVMAFKQIGLEVLAAEKNGGLDKELKRTIKSHVMALLSRISEHEDPFFNGDWIDEWNSICLTESMWFKELWTDADYKTIVAIEKEINTNKVFNDSEKIRPTEQLFKLKNKFNKI